MFKFKAKIKNIDLTKMNERLIYCLSFLLPVILMLGIFISKGIFPFGERSFLRTDLYHQYAPFHSELLYKLHNFKSLFYTYDIGLGTNFLSLIAYYLASPINILLLLCPSQYVIEFVSYGMIFKTGLASLFMSYYLYNKYKVNNISVVLFSLFYGMSGYFAAFSWNVMWLDTVAIFPLLILGFERLYYKKSPYLYIITLGLSILCNYYIAGMACLFLIIYFIYTVIISNEYRFKVIFKKLINVGLYSLIGIAISGIILVPTIFAFKYTASSEFNPPKTIREYFTILEMVARLFPFVKIENGLEHWPNIYVGILTIPSLVLYFMSKKFKTKEKIVNLTLLLFWIASFSINYLDYFWHLFKFPNSLPCRESYIFTFVILAISFKAVTKFNSFKTKDICIAFSIVAAFLILFEKDFLSERLEFQVVYLSLILLLIYIIIFMYIKNKKINKNIILYILLIVVSLEAFFNMHETSITTIKRDNYVGEVKNIRKALDYVKSINNDFYRVERNDRKAKDDGAFINYPSASIFSSSSYKAGTDFYKQLGAEAATNAYSITGSTPFLDSLLNVKYEIYNKDEPNANKIGKRLITTEDNIRIYENIDAMPLSFVLDNDFVESYDYSSGNPATNTNNFARAMNMPVMMENLKMVPNGRTSTTVAELDGDYYAFCRDKSIKEITVGFKDTARTFENLNRGFFMELGYIEKGTIIDFRNDTNDKDLLVECFCFNYSNMRNILHKIRENSDFKINFFNDNNIDYDINVDKEGRCVITLPYDGGFTVWVDGKKLTSDEIKKTFDIFMSFDLSEGTHNIKLKYIPEGFYLGLMLTILGLIALISLYLYRHNLKLYTNDKS